MSPSRPIPAFGVLSAALRKTTEHLAREVAQPGDSPPDWSELEWAIARSVAAMQGISTLLANNLLWSGPPTWQSFLAEQREQAMLRHARIGELLARIDTALRARRIGGIALKGSALRGLGLYAPGERPMGDIDLLVAARDLLPVAAALADVGYTAAFTTERHAVYAPGQGMAVHSFGEHIDNPLKIEVHTAVAETLPVRKVDITGRLRDGRAHEGLNTYPGLASLLWHLLLHAAGNIRGQSLRQIQLHDIAAVAPMLTARDWHTLLDWPRDKKGPWWAFPPLALTARYYPGRVPSDVLRATRAGCPRILRLATERRTLTDVSWSNLRIRALPGIVWSRSPLEALRYVRSRVLPSRSALAELQTTRQAQPHVDQVPWYGVSHGNRIVRWLFSRPPRVQTILSVRAALESANMRATESG